MANEGIIKAQYALAGEVDVTAKILKPDDTVRDDQTAVALNDTGHANIYSNPGAVTIEAGDSIVVYDGAVNIGGEEYQPAAVAVLAAKGFTAGGTLTISILFKLIAAWIAGTWQDKTGNADKKEVLDADDDSTVIMEVLPDEDSPYKAVDIL